MTVSYLARKSHQCFYLAIILVGNQPVQQLFVVGSGLTRIRHHHCLGPMSNLVNGMVHEVVEHHVGLAQLDISILVQLGINDAQRLFLLKQFVLILLGILLDVFKHRLIALIVLQHIEDELLVNGLLHAIEVMRFLSIFTEEGESLVLWRSRKGKVGDVAHVATHNLHVCHQCLHVAVVVFTVKALHILQVLVGGEGIYQVFCTLIANGRMSLVHDDGIFAMFLTLQVFQRIGKLLDGGDNDTMPFVQCRSQVLGTTTDVLHGSGHGFESYDVICHVAVQHNAVSDHDDAVEDGSLIIVGHISQLVSQPCHRLCLARTCRVFNQVIVAWSFCTNQSAKFPDGSQLMITWEVNHGIAVLIVATLEEILNNVEQRVCP